MANERISLLQFSEHCADFESPQAKFIARVARCAEESAAEFGISEFEARAILAAFGVEVVRTCVFGVNAEEYGRGK